MKRILFVAALLVRCSDYTSLVCEPCEGGCSEGLTCEAGRCIAPGASCGLECTRFEPCEGATEICSAGACVGTCTTSADCSGSGPCLDGRCVAACGPTYPCGVEIGAERIADVEVEIELSTFGGVFADVSNDPTFAEAATRRIAIQRNDDTAPLATQTEPWSLAPCAANACPRAVYVRFLDGNGDAIETAEDHVVVDARDPDLAEPPTFELKPPRGAPVETVDRATRDSRLRLSLAFDEPIETLQIGWDGASDAAWQIVRDAPERFTATATITDTPTEGAHILFANATDRVGRATSFDVATVDFDRTPPATPSDLLEHRRVDGVAPRRITAEAGTLEPGVLVRVVDGDGTELGRGVADAAGALDAIEVESEEDVLRAELVDGAGLASERARVHNIRATLRLASDRHTLSYSYGVPIPDDGEIPFEIFNEDDSVENYRGGPWVREASYAYDRLRPLVGATMTFDRRFSQLAQYGGWRYENTTLEPNLRLYTSNTTASPTQLPADASNATLVSAPAVGGLLAVGHGCWVYDTDDWTPLSSSHTCNADTAAYDPSRDETIGASWDELERLDVDLAYFRPVSRFVDVDAGDALVYDEARDRVVVLRRSGYTAVFHRTTGAWGPVDWFPGCPCGLREFGLDRPTVAYDEARGQVVAAGNSDGHVELYTLGDWSWTPIPVTGDRPIDRVGAALAYDPLSRRLILTGGSHDRTSLAPRTDAWAFDGTRWSPLTVVVEQPASGSSSIAYDVARGQAVALVTNIPVDALGPRQDTWIWDSRRWIDTGATLPNSGHDGRVVYHSGLERVVAIQFGQVWTWEGDAWQPLAGAGTPPPNVQLAALAYDPNTDAILAFGPNRTDELWMLGANGWQQIPPTTPWPSPRMRSAFVHDPVSNRMILFGGTDVVGPLRDVWSWDGVAFTQLSAAAISGLPEVNPEAIAYDAASAQVVLLDRGTLYDLDRTNGTWTYRSSDRHREHASLVYDVDEGELLVYGGMDLSGTASRELHRIRGNYWYEAEPEIVARYTYPDGVAMVSETNPPRLSLLSVSRLYGHPGRRFDRWTFGARSFVLPRPGPDDAIEDVPVAAYHQGRETIVVFVEGRTFTSTTGGWIEHVGPGPADRTDHALAYDPATDSVLLFGGRDRVGVSLDDTWTWDGAWTQHPSGPSARYDHAIASDPRRARVVLFGGRSTATAILDDTWIWDGNTWTAAASTGPTARYDSAITFDPDAGEVLLASGVSATGADLTDAWRFGATWRRIGAPVSGTTRALGYDPVAKTIVAYDQYGANVWGRGAISAAGVLLNVEVARATERRALDDVDVEALHFEAGAGGVGVDGREGVELWLHDLHAREYVRVAANTADEDALDHVTATVPGKDLSRFVDRRGRSLVWVRTSSATGDATEIPSLTVDFVRARLDYRIEEE